MRNIDWQQKLIDLVKAREFIPFDWGKYDCCLFAADVVLEMTGKDYASDFRGKYSSEIGAKRLLSKAGGLEVVLSASFDEVEFNFAQRGDLVLVNTDIGPALGIMWVNNSVWLHSPEGVKLYSNINDRILKTWRV